MGAEADAGVGGLRDRRLRNFGVASRTSCNFTTLPLGTLSLRFAT